MKRKQYRALFDMRVRTDPDTGRDSRVAVYTGPYYQIDFPGGAKRALAALWLVCPVLFLAAGLLNTSGSRCFYVLPFYLLLPFPLLYWGMAVFRVLRIPGRATAVDRDEGIERVRRSSGGAAALSALHTAGELVLLVLGGAGERLGAELAGTACILAVGAFGVLTHRVLNALNVTELPAKGTGGDGGRNPPVDDGRA